MEAERELNVLKFIYGRLVHRYKEPTNIDYMNNLNKLIQKYERRKDEANKR